MKVGFSLDASGCIASAFFLDSHIDSCLYAQFRGKKFAQHFQDNDECFEFILEFNKQRKQQILAVQIETAIESAITRMLDVVAPMTERG